MITPNQRILLLSSGLHNENGKRSALFKGHEDTIVNLFDGRDVLYIRYAQPPEKRAKPRTVVTDKFEEFGLNLISLDESKARDAIEDAAAFYVSGGNTWALAYQFQWGGLGPIIKRKIDSGTPYMGGSAGAVTAGQYIGSTNDNQSPMHNQVSSQGLGVIPFMIKPHFLGNFSPEVYGGETHSDRVREFFDFGSTIPVLGMPEGSGVLVQNGRTAYRGPTGTLFRKIGEVVEEASIEHNSTLDALL